MKRFVLLFIFITTLVTSAQEYRGVDYVIEKAIGNKITPGASIIVGTPDKILYHKAYGHFTYDKSSPATDTSSMFDLASVTKVIATTSSVMKLVDEGRLDIEKPVAFYIPEFGSNGKENVKVRNLLLHNSGLPAYYSPKEGQTREQLFDIIFNLPKEYETGSKMLYSCLNFITLMKVTEAVTGEPMYKFFAENFTEPLGMDRTMFNPPASMKDNIVPASPELQGQVHDPLANALGGLSGNAGLFSTTGDLAEVCRMMLKKGTLDGHRYYKPETVEKFTATYDSSLSSRGLGWDTNIELNKACGPLFSPESFGHTGYTGTSVWCDPERELFVVLLTNRVYPDDQASVSGLRINVHNAVVMEYDKIPSQPVVTGFAPQGDKLVMNWDNKMILGPVIASDIYLDRGDGFEKIKEFGTEVSEYEVPFDYDKNVTYGFKVVNRSDKKESEPSDTYVFRGNEKDILIIDGDDAAASEEKPVNLSVVNHADAIPDGYSFMTINNDELTEMAEEASEYKTIFWILGEDNTAGETFTPEEQKFIKDYLAAGGNILISGAEIGWAIGRRQSRPDDRSFYNNVLKAEFAGDNADTHGLIGKEIFDGIAASFGTEDALYHPGYPDFITVTGDAAVCLDYDNGKTAGVNYKSEGGGKLVYLGFPFETIVKKETRQEMVKRLLTYFNEK